MPHIKEGDKILISENLEYAEKAKISNVPSFTPFKRLYKLIRNVEDVLLETSARLKDYKVP